jgi:hypothetical protein
VAINRVVDVTILDVIREWIISYGTGTVFWHEAMQGNMYVAANLVPLVASNRAEVDMFTNGEDGCLAFIF